MKSLIICFVMTTGILGWLISTHLDNPRLVPLLIIMPIFIVGTLFAVFGKDLLKRNPKPDNTSQKESRT